MRRLSPVLLLLFAALLFVAAGCGSDEDSSDEPTAAATSEGGTSGDEAEESEEEEESATPEQAVEEIAEIKTMLGEAVSQLESGDREQAEETVGDAYLEHFEKVEHPLEEQDEELMEELEVLISTTIRNEIKDGKPGAVKGPNIKLVIVFRLRKAASRSPSPGCRCRSAPSRRAR